MQANERFCILRWQHLQNSEMLISDPGQGETQIPPGASVPSSTRDQTVLFRWKCLAIIQAVNGTCHILSCHTQSQTLHWPTLSTFPESSALILEAYTQQMALFVTAVHLGAMHRKTPVPRRAEAFVAQASRYHPSACTGWLLEFSITGYRRTQCMSTM